MLDLIKGIVLPAFAFAAMIAAVMGIALMIDSPVKWVSILGIAIMVGILIICFGFFAIAIIDHVESKN